MLVTQNDVEILRASKPDSGNLSITLLQKAIVDFYYGIMLTTGAMSIYFTFDFITFSETLFNKEQLQEG
jgi:hypothetical protein